MVTWQPADYSDLAGWLEDDHQAALACFRMSARAIADGRPVSREATKPGAALVAVAKKALELQTANLGNSGSREFFEHYFQPMSVPNRDGFVTAYFEPEVSASRLRTDKYSYPLLGRPKDLVKLKVGHNQEGLSGDLEYARKTSSGLVEFYDREQIDKGALANRGLELFWVTSAIEAFYIHVQGSARLSLTDGTSARVSFAGKTGHPYTSIGKVLVQRGVFTVEEANMKNMRKWLEADIDRAMELLHQNRSYIFFAEVEGHEPGFGPIAAAGVQLTPGRSIAIDKSVHAYGTPIWIGTENPLPFDKKPFRRLMIAQDTGSAIVGPQRGDLFIGSGSEAGEIAGSVRHDTQFVILRAREV